MPLDFDWHLRINSLEIQPRFSQSVECQSRYCLNLKRTCRADGWLNLRVHPDRRDGGGVLANSLFAFSSRDYSAALVK